MIERADFLVCHGRFPWIKMIPLKVLRFVWHAKQNKIATAEALRNRGIVMDSSLCGVCRESEETGDHLLVSCTIAKDTLNSIFNWCNVQVSGIHSSSFLYFDSLLMENKDYIDNNKDFSDNNDRNVNQCQMHQDRKKIRRCVICLVLVMIGGIVFKQGSTDSRFLLRQHILGYE
ncbi:unnamed protein product [Lactuca saligna]|uniref:Reverse transcriptase zinc-binding domain-containing protein n=1 Tax=Lactuca saligna TaxID=75948 RepID=A0AA35UZ44_LACSI|nr:unnamed protein product [Lactuca saligna]